MGGRRSLYPLSAAPLLFTLWLPMLQAGSSQATAQPPAYLGTYVPIENTLQRCPEMAAYGAHYTWTTVIWEGVEPQRDIFSWSQMDGIINGLRNCGFDIGVHVLSQSDWGALPVPAGTDPENASMPPRNSRDYYTFIYRLASRYRGMITRYSIENEAAASTNWPSSPESYFQMLATAYSAVHAADPHAIVEDSALSSTGLGVLLGWENMKVGDRQGAADYLNHFFEQYGPRQPNGFPMTLTTGADLDNFFALPEVQRLLAWAPLLFANHAYYDIQQLHYFGPVEDLPGVMGWVHSQLQAHGIDKSLDLWETGYAWLGVNTFDPQAQARETPKYLTTALGEGAQRVIQWMYTDYAFAAEGHPGLVADAGPRPAAQAFAVTAAKLNGTTGGVSVSLGDHVTCYRFSKGASRVYVIWAEEATVVSLPTAPQTVTVTDIANQVTTASSQGVNVGVSPVFVNLN